MSKLSTGIIIGLLVVVAAGCWAVFGVEKGRQDLELRQLEAQRQSALESEAYGAWRHATRYETFRASLANSQHEPKRSETLSNRQVWVKSYQRPDIKANGKSQKYGNATYQVNTIIAFNDRLSSGMLDVALRSRVPMNVVNAAIQGEWHSLTMQCKLERLDGGEWIASDYIFAPASTKPDFPFDRVKGED